ncbi:transglycosylase SLT domain-containing protein [Moraxella ovis]|uniref:transglycosylase SLT domain-containing protein n=1 Tax=Moraxella ovis TaxID=29433 RepID=UPI00215DB167|nr:transglycosylase SLT domain-containing protein [Moraxella ovis]
MGNPDTNIRYGTWFLSDLAGKSGYQIAVATAGYNAGPGAARRWLPTHGPIGADHMSRPFLIVRRVITSSTSWKCNDL